MRALAEALFPGLHQDAQLAQSANQEAIATFFATSAAKMDFVIAAVSSWLLSSAEPFIYILCEAPTPGWGSWQFVYPPWISQCTRQRFGMPSAGPPPHRLPECVPRTSGLHDMCSLSCKSCTIHLVYVQVIQNMEKLTPENQKELAL